MKKSKLPLTIIILTHRNDSRFVDCLSSAQIAEKVLIIDNNSHNNWQKLKDKYSFTLVSLEDEILDYSKIRNEAIKQVKTNWLLFLDSDEVLGRSAEELNENSALIEEIINDDIFDAITIRRKDIFLDKELNYGEAGNTKIIRMFKKDKAKFHGNVHEVAIVLGKLGNSEILISHFSHPSITEFLSDVSRYSKLASENQRDTLVENIFKMITFPIGKFFLNYFFKLGFLDGYRGLVYALMMSMHSFFTRVFYFEKFFAKRE